MRATRYINILYTDTPYTPFTKSPSQAPVGPSDTMLGYTLLETTSFAYEIYFSKDKDLIPDHHEPSQLWKIKSTDRMRRRHSPKFSPQLRTTYIHGWRLEWMSSVNSSCQTRSKWWKPKSSSQGILGLADVRRRCDLPCRYIHGSLELQPDKYITWFELSLQGR